jgi:hypothetical protein
VHRDIKPANLMRTPDGTIKILDLGLARRTASAADACESEQTRPGDCLGTCDYMAPEQAENARRADPRSDLYSLGCTFYYLLTGRPPFDQGSPVHKLFAHARDIPPSPEQVRPDVPAAIAAILAKLLAKRPEDRYPSARALIEALDTATGSRPPESRFTVPKEPCATPAQVPVTLEPLTGGCDLPKLLAPESPVPFIAHVSSITDAAPDRIEPRPLARRGATGVPWRWYFLAAGFGMAGLILWLVLAGLGDPTASPFSRSPALVVRKLEVRRLAKVGQFDEPRGALGVKWFSARLGDGVTIRGELSEAAFCYLIAYRPDGTEDICFPGDQHTPPPLTDRPSYPPLAQLEAVELDVSYGLDEGEGLMAFVLLVSRRPLPPFEEWCKRCGQNPWRKADAPRDVVWRFDGQELLATTLEDPTGTRSKGRKRRGVDSLVELINWLRAAPNVETVAAVAFPVLPAAE